MKWTLPTPTSFSLQAVVESHGWSQLAPFRRDNPSGLSCVIELADGTVVDVELTQGSRGLSVIVLPGVSASGRADVESRVRWMLGLDEDLEPFFEIAKGTPELERARSQRFGRLLRSPTLFEDIVKTILTTNTTWSGTKRMVSRLVEKLGPGPSAERGRFAFPGPEPIAAADPSALGSEIGMGYRAPYVHELASRVASGELDTEALKQSGLPTLELRKELLDIKGVGPYAAATLLMLLGRYDFLPVDSWSLKLVSHEWYGGESVGRSEVESAFERWGPWKALVYWFWDWELLKQRAEQG